MRALSDQTTASATPSADAPEPQSLADYFASAPYLDRPLQGEAESSPPTGDAAEADLAGAAADQGQDGVPPEPVAIDAEQEALRAQNALLAQQLAQSGTWYQQQLAAQAQAEQAAEWQRLQARWTQMDPAEANVERASYAVQQARLREQYLANQLAQRDAALTQLGESQARTQVVDLLTTRFGLKADEIAAIRDFNDPYDMERAAAAFQSRRSTQTQAARSAVAQQRLASGVDRAAGGGTGGPPAKEPGSMAELFASIPYQAMAPRR